MCTVQHQPYIPWGTEAIPRVHCYRPQGSEQKERCGRFGPIPPSAGFEAGAHPPRRGAPDRCLRLSITLLSVLSHTGGHWLSHKTVLAVDTRKDIHVCPVSSSRNILITIYLLSITCHSPTPIFYPQPPEKILI